MEHCNIQTWLDVVVFCKWSPRARNACASFQSPVKTRHYEEVHLRAATPARWQIENDTFDIRSCQGGSIWISVTGEPAIFLCYCYRLAAHSGRLLIYSPDRHLTIAWQLEIRVNLGRITRHMLSMCQSTPILSVHSQFHGARYCWCLWYAFINLALYDKHKESRSSTHGGKK